MEYKICKLKYKYVSILIFLYSKIKNISPTISKKIEKYIVNVTKRIFEESYSIIKK